MRKKTSSSGGRPSIPQSTREPPKSSLKQMSSHCNTAVPASAPAPRVRAASAPSFLRSNFSPSQSASAAGTSRVQSPPHSYRETHLERLPASENDERKNQGISSAVADALDNRNDVEGNINRASLVRDDLAGAVEQDENRSCINGNSERDSINELASGKMAVEHHTASNLAMSASLDKGGGSQLAGIDRGRITWAFQTLEQHATLWGKTTLDLLQESVGESTSPVASNEVSDINVAASQDGSPATVSVKWEDQRHFCRAVLIIERHAKLEGITVLDLLQDEKQQQKRVNYHDQEKNKTEPQQLETTSHDSYASMCQSSDTVLDLLQEEEQQRKRFNHHAPEKNKTGPMHPEIISNESYASMCQALEKIERFANEVGVAPINVVDNLEGSYAVKLDKMIALDFGTSASGAESVDTFRDGVTDIFDYISCKICCSSGSPTKFRKSS